MADITLTAAVRDSLLSLQNTTNLIDRTQSRLSTGLRVAGPVDDPVSYFQAKSLNDRAFDFTEKKSSIEQGISTVTAALDSVNAIETLVRQMKGIVNSMKSATTTQMADLVTQFNDLRTQINNLASDSSYQGTNLVNGTGVELSVEFSNDTASRLTVNSVDLTVATQGLNIEQQSRLDTATLNASTYSASTYSPGTAGNADRLAAAITAGNSLTITWEGTTTTFNSASGDLTFSYGTGSLTVRAYGDQTLAAGDTLQITVATAYGTAAFTVVSTDQVSFGATYAASGAGSSAWSGNESLTFTYQGPTFTYNTGNTTGIAFTYNGASLVLKVTEGMTQSLSAGQTFEVYQSTSTTGAATQAFYISAVNTGAGELSAATAAGADYGNYGLKVASSMTGADNSAINFVKAGDTTNLNTLLQNLDTALTSLRTEAQKLGTNVALLQTRLDFTESYVNTLTAGASKLTLADVNEEGANLLALQTRQQLGIQALSFAGQAEQSILSLFR